LTGERGPLVSTEQVILSTLLGKSFSAEVTFWWVFTWNTNTFTSFTHLESPITYLFPSYLCHQFSNHTPSQSLAVQLNPCLQPMNQHIVTRLAIFLLGKMIIRCPSQTSAYYKAFFSPLLQRCSRARLEVIAAHFQVGLACHIDHLQTRPESSLPLPTVYRSSPSGPGAGQERRQCSRCTGHAFM
jgi:hypothetical protein